MNVIELSHLCTVINQLKTIVNTSSLSRFDKETTTTLKRKVDYLEKTFIQEVTALNLDQVTNLVKENAPLKTKKSKEAITTDIKTTTDVESKVTVVEMVQDNLPPPVKNASPKTTVTTDNGMVVVEEIENKPSSYIQPDADSMNLALKLDPSYADLLKQAKAQKKKKKNSENG